MGIIYDVFTLYMLALLLRWMGPFISLDLEQGRLRWLPRITDPLVSRIRKTLPSLGPVDFSPMVAVLLIWFLREITIALVSPVRMA